MHMHMRGICGRARTLDGDKQHDADLGRDVQTLEQAKEDAERGPRLQRRRDGKNHRVVGVNQRAPAVVPIGEGTRGDAAADDADAAEDGRQVEHVEVVANVQAAHDAGHRLPLLEPVGGRRAEANGSTTPGIQAPPSILALRHPGAQCGNGTSDAWAARGGRAGGGTAGGASTHSP